MTWAGRAAVALLAGPFLVLSAASSLAGDDPPKRPGDPQAAQPPGRALGRAFPQGAAELLTYGLTPEQFRELESTELITLVEAIYRPEKAEQDRVAAEIGRIQAGRWENNPDIQPYTDLLSKRAVRYQALSQELNPTDSPWKQIRQLRRDPEFSKLLSDIKQFEYKHTHNLNGHLEQIESLIDPAKVEQAHQDWPRRVRSLRAVVQVARLCDGLQTRKVLLQQQDPSAAKAGEPALSKLPPPAPGTNRSRRQGPQTPRERVQAAPAPSTERSRPLNEWEKYVYEFIERYELTEAQSNSALAILRELSSRAAQLETMNRDRLAAAEKITDLKVRQERIAGLSKPTDDLFGQLKQRLDRLLSAEQRNNAANQPPQPRAGRADRRGP